MEKHPYEEALGLISLLNKEVESLEEKLIHATSLLSDLKEAKDAYVHDKIEEKDLRVVVECSRKAIVKCCKSVND